MKRWICLSVLILSGAFFRKQDTAARKSLFMLVNRSVPDVAQKRKDWNGLISGFKASDLVFLDESGCNTDMTRRYAYSLEGSRAVDSAPLSKPKNTTILSSIQLDGTLRYTTFSGGTTVERFKRYLETDLLPHLNGSSVLILLGLGTDIFWVCVRNHPSVTYGDSSPPGELRRKPVRGDSTPQTIKIPNYKQKQQNRRAASALLAARRLLV